MTAADHWNRLEPRQCPVCGSCPTDSAIFLKQSIDPSRLTSHSYASRKTPEFMRYELVACPQCETVYASSAPPKGVLARAYHEAQYGSAEEAKLASETYGMVLSPHLATLPSRLRALEIGTGTGVFLSHLQQVGFSDVVGVEPSLAAIAAADADVRPLIRAGVFVEDDFPPEHFDLICCFQTLEHVLAPRTMLRGCARLLRKGGLMALVTHDYRAPVNRLLGRRSPIIDIEHLQLFCRPSLERLLSIVGLQIVAIDTFSNQYRLTYWLRLTPVPVKLKSVISQMMLATGIGNFRLRFNVGNLLTIGRKVN